MHFHLSNSYFLCIKEYGSGSQHISYALTIIISLKIQFFDRIVCLIFYLTKQMVPTLC